MKQSDSHLKIGSSKITTALVCYQEKESLKFVLEDLKQQTVFHQIGEVLLFQNGGCEKTRKTGQSFLNQLPLKILSSPDNNLGSARSTVVKQAQYDWIAWTDSDCRLPVDWLEKLISHWDKSNQRNLTALGGPNRLPEKYLWQKAVNLSFDFAIGHGWSPQTWIPKQPAQTQHIPTTNGLFLKQAILKAGNFSPARPFVGEDLDLGRQLKKQGKMLLFPSPIVTNNYADSYWGHFKRCFIFGKAQSQRKSLLFYLSMPFALFMLFSLALSFFWSFFLLAPIFYSLLLLSYSLFAFLKAKKKTAFLLPIFWLGQHSCYSLGSTAGLFAEAVRNRKNQS